jgi:hypothetical protein
MKIMDRHKNLKGLPSMEPGRNTSLTKPKPKHVPSKIISVSINDDHFLFRKVNHFSLILIIFLSFFTTKQ